MSCYSFSYNNLDQWGKHKLEKIRGNLEAVMKSFQEPPLLIDLLTPFLLPFVLPT